MNRLAYCFLAISAEALLLAGCKVEPEPIVYGSDACHFCRMTIVDQTHAAQLVTAKGKQFKYDAIECLVNNLPAWQVEDIGLLLVADYPNPGKMVEVETATFLISEEIRSPMGANLSAFAERSASENAQRQHGGQLFNWDELPAKLKMPHGGH